MTSYGRNDAGWFSFRQSEAAPPLGKAPRRHFRLRERCTSGDSFKNSSPHVRVVRIPHSARFVDLATAFPATRPSASRRPVRPSTRSGRGPSTIVAVPEHRRARSIPSPINDRRRIYHPPEERRSPPAGRYGCSARLPLCFLPLPHRVPVTFAAAEKHAIVREQCHMYAVW